MTKEMLINVSEGEECRIALLEDGRLEELYMERTSATSHVGNIYKGRVTNVEASIQAAFVDFGLGRNGFLHISDLMPTYFGRRGEEIVETVGKKMSRRDRPPIQRCLRRGDEIVVQIIKEGIGTKGPTLSTYLSIPGRILVMMPGLEKMGVSRKIEDDEERRRLRQILDSLKPPEGVGFIIRTAGIGKSKTEIQRDLTYLTRVWQSLEKTRESSPAPVELYTEGDLVTRTVRDVFSTEIDRIIVDNKDVARRVKDVIKLANPRTKNRVELYEEPVPLFHKFGIEKDIEMMYSRHVPLPSGGSLVIDSTEAVVAIDVNSGKFRDHSDAETTAFKTDMEAADEIPRQLRLRDLGGVIICDFIDLRFERHRRELEERLSDHFKNDRAKTKVLRMSQFGIIEMTRQRMRPSLKRSIYFDCPHCKGAGLVKTPESMSLDVMRRLAIAVDDPRVVRVELSVYPDAAFYLLNRKRSQIAQLEDAADKRVVIKSDASLGLDEMRLDLFDTRDGLVVVDQLAGVIKALPNAPQQGRRGQQPRGGGRGDQRGRGSERGGSRDQNSRRGGPPEHDASPEDRFDEDEEEGRFEEPESGLVDLHDGHEPIGDAPQPIESDHDDRDRDHSDVDVDAEADHPRSRNDRGPSRHQRGPGRNDRGPARNDRGPTRDNRGPARDDRGPARDDHDPAAENHDAAHDESLRDGPLPHPDDAAAHAPREGDEGTQDGEPRRRRRRRRGRRGRGGSQDNRQNLPGIGGPDDAPANQGALPFGDAADEAQGELHDEHEGDNFSDGPGDRIQQSVSASNPEDHEEDHDAPAQEAGQQTMGLAAQDQQNRAQPLDDEEEMQPPGPMSVPGEDDYYEGDPGDNFGNRIDYVQPHERPRNDRNNRPGRNNRGGGGNPRFQNNRPPQRQGPRQPQNGSFSNSNNNRGQANNRPPRRDGAQGPGNDRGNANQNRNQNRDPRDANRDQRGPNRDQRPANRDFRDNRDPNRDPNRDQNRDPRANQNRGGSNVSAGGRDDRNQGAPNRTGRDDRGSRDNRGPRDNYEERDVRPSSDDQIDDRDDEVQPFSGRDPQRNEGGRQPVNPPARRNDRAPQHNDRGPQRDNRGPQRIDRTPPRDVRRDEPFDRDERDEEPRDDRGVNREEPSRDEDRDLRNDDRPARPARRDDRSARNEERDGADAAVPAARQDEDRGSPESQPAETAAADAPAADDEAKPRRRRRGGRGRGRKAGAAPATDEAPAGDAPVANDEARQEPGDTGGAAAQASPQIPLPPVVRTGSSDRHLISDEPIDPEPIRRPRSYRDLDQIPDDLD